MYICSIYMNPTYSELNFTPSDYNVLLFLENKEAICSLCNFCNHGSVLSTRFWQSHCNKQMNEDLLFSSVFLFCCLLWQNGLSCHLICIIMLCHLLNVFVLSEGFYLTYIFISLNSTIYK